MKNLASEIVLTIKAQTALSPGGVQLDWLSYLVGSPVDEVKQAATLLVRKGHIQEPFTNIYLPKGRKVLIANNPSDAQPIKGR